SRSNWPSSTPTCGGSSPSRRSCCSARSAGTGPATSRRAAMRPALATVLDARTLLIPERRGNRRADSLRNIIETGRAALLFLIPGVGETLRVNGRACVIRDEEVLAPMAVDGKRPLVGIAVEVEECFLQCAKAVIRSKLW